MRHYIPLQTSSGWAVVYGNHRGEFIAVMDCNTLQAAYNEAAAMTLDATKRALCDTPPENKTAHIGNRYLRSYA